MSSAFKVVSSALVPFAVARQAFAPSNFAYSASNRLTTCPDPRFHLPLRNTPAMDRSSVSSKTGHDGKGVLRSGSPPNSAGFPSAAALDRLGAAATAPAIKLPRMKSRRFIHSSKCQPHAELNCTRRVSGGCNPAHLRRHADIAGRDIKVGVIHNVEEFSAKLDVDPLGNVGFLVHRLIPVYDARTEQGVARRVPVGVGRGHSVGGGVEPLIDRARTVRIADDIRAAARPTDHRAVECHREWLSGAEARNARNLPSAKDLIA